MASRSGAAIGFLALVFGLGAATGAGATPVEVKYLVDKKLDGTTASTVLTFNLYSDDTCTTLIATDVAPAGASTVRIERVLPKKLKEGDKPPRPSDCSRSPTRPRWLHPSTWL